MLKPKVPKPYNQTPRLAEGLFVGRYWRHPWLGWRDDPKLRYGGRSELLKKFKVQTRAQSLQRLGFTVDGSVQFAICYV